MPSPSASAHRPSSVGVATFPESTVVVVTVSTSRRSNLSRSESDSSRLALM